MRPFSLTLKATFLGAALALSGCIDVDLDTRILGPDEANVTGFMTIERAMLDMMGGADEFCPADEGGTIDLSDTTARCNLDRSGTFAEIFEPDPDGVPSPTAENLGDGTVRVTFPLGAMTADTDEMRSDPGMVAMFLPMLEGHSITMRISGAQIVSSNGDIAADGTSASITFGLADLLQDDFEVPEVFEAVVRY
jgi:hypothetical protein